MYSFLDLSTSTEPVYTTDRAVAYNAFVRNMAVYKEGKLMKWFGPDD